MGLEIKLEELNLLNVGDGELDARFQEEMQKVGLWASQLGAYRTNKDGQLAVKVVLEVEYVFEQNGSTIVLCDAHAKEPRRKRGVGSVHVNRGRFYNVIEPEQGPLFQDASANDHGDKDTAAAANQEG